MKGLLPVLCSMSLVAPCLAEPGQINMKPLQTAIRANSALRDGRWLLQACEQHEAWGRVPDGTLWKGRESSEESLGAGLCAGFVTGVLGAPGVPSSVAGRSFDPGRILKYLRDHASRLDEPAGPLVIEAMRHDGP